MSKNVLCTVFLFLPRLAPCISDCDPRAPQLPPRMFLLWKLRCEKVGRRVTAMGCVLVLLSHCVLLFFCGFGSFPGSHKTQKKSPHPPLSPLFLIRFSFLPAHSFFASLLGK